MPAGQLTDVANMQDVETRHARLGLIPPARADRPASAGRLAVLTVLAVHAPLVAAMGLLLVVSQVKSIPYSDFTRDAVTALDGAYYVGWLSNLGATLWLAGASIGLFAAVTLPAGAWRRFLLHAGLLTAVLGADDLFLIHDGILPQFLGGSELLAFGAYGGALGLILITHRALLPDTCWPLLVLAVICFGTSLAVDLAVVPVPEHHRHLAEDGAKLLGIASWSSLLVLTAVRSVREEIAAGGGGLG